jgi:hypothetical protein
VPFGVGRVVGVHVVVIIAVQRERGTLETG